MAMAICRLIWRCVPCGLCQHRGIATSARAGHSGSHSAPLLNRSGDEPPALTLLLDKPQAELVSLELQRLQHVHLCRAHCKAAAGESERALSADGCVWAGAPEGGREHLPSQGSPDFLKGCAAFCHGRVVVDVVGMRHVVSTLQA